MPDARISELPLATTLGDTDIAPLVQASGATTETRRATLAQLRGAVLADRGAQPDDWVLVHDAARCLVQPAWIDRLIDACLPDEVGGLLALPVADTLKDEREGRVHGTVDRAHKWQAQTPQMFRLGLLRDALQAAHVEIFDAAWWRDVQARLRAGAYLDVMPYPEAARL